MLDRVRTINDFDCSYYKTSRLSNRKGYVVTFTARLDGEVVQSQLSFDKEQMRLIGMKQAKEMVLDNLLVQLNRRGL
jgi:hypothetical protein